MVLFYGGSGPKTSCPGDVGGVSQLPEDVECDREGLLQFSSKSQIVSPSFCVFFWDFGHPPAGIWPGMSLSVMTPVAGQARAGLFEYTPGCLPSAAGAPGRGWLC